jgi:hypothetical protein
LPDLTYQSNVLFGGFSNHKFPDPFFKVSILEFPVEFLNCKRPSEHLLTVLQDKILLF